MEPAACNSAYPFVAALFAAKVHLVLLPRNIVDMLLPRTFGRAIVSAVQVAVSELPQRR